MLKLKESAALVTERGKEWYTYRVLGLPFPQEALIINWGTMRYPDWHIHKEVVPGGRIVRTEASYRSAEDARIAFAEALTGQN